MNEEKYYHAKEVYPGLIVGALWDLDDILAMKPDVLVPLDRLPPRVWEKGFRGEIIYCPVPDMGILPDDVLEWLTEQITDRVRKGKKTAVFCIGGHGRTGYAAACALYRLGIRDPIAYLRSNYSVRAVETESQEQAVYAFCGQGQPGPELKRMTRTIEVRDADAFENDPAIGEILGKINREIEPPARLLVRRSGTGGVFTLIIETQDIAVCAKYMERFVSAIRACGHLLYGEN